VALPPYDDLKLSGQPPAGAASMDYILGHKAVFKKTTEHGRQRRPRRRPPSRANNIHRNDGIKSDNAQNTAIALGLIGVGSKIFSAATTPQADTRTWTTCRSASASPPWRLPPGEHPATLEFFHSEGNGSSALETS